MIPDFILQVIPELNINSVDFQALNGVLVCPSIVYIQQFHVWHHNIYKYGTHFQLTALEITEVLVEFIYHVNCIFVYSMYIMHYIFIFYRYDDSSKTTKIMISEVGLIKK